MVRPLPDSSKKVLEELTTSMELTHRDLVINTGLAPRTVRFALKRLKDHNLLIEKFNFSDARQVIYQLKPEVKECTP